MTTVTPNPRQNLRHFCRGISHRWLSARQGPSWAKSLFDSIMFHLVRQLIRIGRSRRKVLGEQVACLLHRVNNPRSEL